MKKFSIVAILIALIVASFALPSFAQDGCDASVNYLQLGHSQLNAGDFSGALHSANCGLSFDSDSYALWMLRADVYCDTGDFVQAASDFGRAIEANPESAQAYNYRGWANYQAGNLEAAMSDYNTAIELDSDLAYAYNNRGLIWQIWGDRELALADYEMAIELGLEEPWAEVNLYNLQFEILKLGEK